MKPDDFLREEQGDEELIASLSSLYQTNPADAESLQRIRARLLKREHAALPFPQHDIPAVREPANGVYRHRSTARTERQARWIHHLNMIAAVITVSLIVGSLVFMITRIGHPGTAALPHGGQRVPIGRANLKIVDSSTIWLPTSLYLTGQNIASGPLLRTTDGGATWQDVTPPQQDFSLSDVYPLDRNTAWLLTSVERTVNASPGQKLYRTVDGGASWQLLSLPTNEVKRLIFVDRDHGWLLGQVGAGSDRPLSLFTTIDGGKTWWQQIPDVGELSVYTGIQFVNPLVGWLTVPATEKNGAKFYATRDGGKTWQLLTIPEVVEPIRSGVAKNSDFFTKFFNERDGYMVVWSWQSDRQEFHVYPTHDGGKTWQARASITVMSPDAFFSLVNDRQIVITYRDVVAVRTLINGQWVETSHQMLRSGRILTSSFISGTTGLALVNYTDHQGNTTVMNGDDLRVLKTTDSGKTWTTLSLISPTSKVTPTSMRYLASPGWTYVASDVADGSAGGQIGFSPKDRTKDGLDKTTMPDLKAKKWLVRFMCTGTTSAQLKLNTQSFSASNCDQRPVSTVVSFAAPQSIQRLQVGVSARASWMAVLMACTDENVCKADAA